MGGEEACDIMVDVRRDGEVEEICGGGMKARGDGGTELRSGAMFVLNCFCF